MEIPGWLRTANSGGAQPSPSGVGKPVSQERPGEPFADKTLQHVLSFVEDAMFNEVLSSRNGLLQKIEPRLKIITLLIFIFALSLQKSLPGIAAFLLLAAVLVAASQIPFQAFLKKLLPAAVITLCVAVPAMLNLVVPGDPLLVFLKFQGPVAMGPIILPKELAITAQGLKSALTLLLRVVASVSFVFLMIMTTRPNTFMKSVSSMVPGSLSYVVSMSYRYIFLLVRKIEQFIMGLKSRQLAAVKTSGGQRWAASRMGLLFSVSMELSDELAKAMESRGYCSDKSEVRNPPGLMRVRRGGRLEIKARDMLWLTFTLLFCGVMFWKSL